MVPEKIINTTSNILVITGPTATGKTTTAIKLAQEFNKTNGHTQIEIINADSVLVFKEFNIGSAKPTEAEKEGIPHHLINICDPLDDFSAGIFVEKVDTAISDICTRGMRPLIVGGSGFYLKALLHGLWDVPRANKAYRLELEQKTNDELKNQLALADPDALNTIHINDRYRLIRALEMIHGSNKSLTEIKNEHKNTVVSKYNFHLWILDRENADLLERIKIRAKLMLDSGLVNETETLFKKYPGAKILNSVGYKEVMQHILGHKPEGRKIAPGTQGLIDEIILATKHLVKKQRTWFKGEQGAHWFPPENDFDEMKTKFLTIYK